MDVVSQIPLNGKLQILDLGGEEAYWSDKVDLLARPVAITLLNKAKFQTSRPEISSLKGDARALSDFADNSFDIVHSNSVIEHVGQWHDMKAMASEVRRLAPAYFVQTPYFWFPVEPHFRFLGFHWLPEPIRAGMIMRRGHGFIRRQETFDEAMRTIQSSVLLDRRMFSHLFPDAKIVFETWCGFPKSLMAIRNPA